MKIVHELNQLDYGGVEKVIRNIAKFDKANEHFIIAYKDGKYRQKLEEVGIKIFLVNEHEDHPEDFEADVIHVHSGGGVSNLALNIGHDFPVVETIHSPVRSALPAEFVYQRVGVSDAVARMNHNAITIKNGIDIDEMDPKIDRETIMSRMGWDPSKPVIGRLGRLGKDKGLEEWILTCYYLQQEGFDFTPVIIGGEARDCEGYRGKLKLMCESLPVKGVVWLANTNDISEYMQCMDIFLYPSATEGFGLVLIEAIINGCMVVSYDNDVNREIIGGYSVLVDQKKGIPGLVEGVKKCLNTELKDAILGSQVDFVMSEYDAERMSHEYQELYERCYADFNRKVKSQAADFVSVGADGSIV